MRNFIYIRMNICKYCTHRCTSISFIFLINRLQVWKCWSLCDIILDYSIIRNKNHREYFDCTSVIFQFSKTLCSTIFYCIRILQFNRYLYTITGCVQCFWYFWNEHTSQSARVFLAYHFFRTVLCFWTLCEVHRKNIFTRKRLVIFELRIPVDSINESIVVSGMILLEIWALIAKERLSWFAL